MPTSLEQSILVRIAGCQTTAAVLGFASCSLFVFFHVSSRSRRVACGALSIAQLPATASSALQLPYPSHSSSHTGSLPRLKKSGAIES